MSGATFGFGGLPGGGEGDHTIVGGVAPPGTHRVVISGPGDVSLDAVLLRKGPRPCEQLFGQIFAGPGPTSGVNFRITALDAAGATVATLEL